MSRMKGAPGVVRRAKQGVQSVLFGGRLRNEWHWFDHPEMRGRIAEAEADRREGRVIRADTPEEIEAYLKSLA